MPELPEVEIVKSALAQSCIGKQIASIEKLTDKSLRIQFDSNIEDSFNNDIIATIKRIGKYIIFEFKKSDHALIFHLGMTGKLLYYPSEYKEAKHDHIMIKFTDNHKIIFNDQRRFGFVDICHASAIRKQKFIKNVGIEPFDLIEEKLMNLLQKHKNRSMKNFLMNNSIICGIGNIYASEILFDAGIKPTRIAGQVKEPKILKNSIIKILNKAIKAGGSSISDYKHVDGNAGKFQNEFMVYGRKRQNCYKCGDIITHIRQNGRSSFYCKTCQI